MGLHRKYKQLFVAASGDRRNRGLYMMYIDVESGELFLKRHLRTHSEPINVSTNGNILYITYANESGRRADGGIYNYSIMPGQLSLVTRLAYQGHTFNHVYIQKETHHVFAAGGSTPELACGLMNPKNHLKMKEFRHLVSRKVEEDVVSETVHCGTTGDLKRAYLVDKGTDEIFFYEYNEEARLEMDETMTMKFEEGSAPVSMLFSKDGKTAYVLLSKKSVVKVYHYEDLKFEEIQELSLMPEGYEGENVSQSLHFDDEKNYMFVTNDGHHSVSFIKILEDGKLSLLKNVEVGAGPCDLTVVRYDQFCDNTWVVVVCRKQERLETLTLDRVNDLLLPLRSGYPLYNPHSIAHSDIITR